MRAPFLLLLDEGSTLAGQPASRRRAQWSADRAPLRPGEWRSCDDGSEYAAGVGDQLAKRGELRLPFSSVPPVCPPAYGTSSNFAHALHSSRTLASSPRNLSASSGDVVACEPAEQLIETSDSHMSQFRTSIQRRGDYVQSGTTPPSGAQTNLDGNCPLDDIASDDGRSQCPAAAVSSLRRIEIDGCPPCILLIR